MTDLKSKPDAPSELRSAVEASSKKKRNILITVAAVVVAALVAGGIFLATSLGGKPADDADARTGADGAPAARLSLKLAVAEDSQFQDALKEVAAEKGLDVEWVNVDDWVLPNTELVAGNVDGNAFQHILYLSAFNAENNADLTPVFSTVITQWGIFSKTLKDVADIPDGGRIAIPDDPSNGGRALFILEAAGLIEIADDAGDFPTVEDVTDNPKHLEFVALGARAIPTQFDDPSLSAVVVGTSYFDPAQNVTKDDALFLDDSLAEQNLPYVNVVATTAANADNPAWKILEEAYADPRVKEALDAENFGNTVLVKVPVEKLRDKLAELQKAAAQN
ncbi:MetQ/NlpA family ABC transporter substrate-binding protein [Protaetiibacter larvae]|uniref:MetQ/NlpA family ABC transporter substrate-binding protein n=1 Tax=Protaetiibacter larvae TaxID=2592654 RepID=UPI001FEC9AE3|nr:MetQ/NlpA family ABC transporter substrate-binding protein [Protaetiibacter larvae]